MIFIDHDVISFNTSLQEETIVLAASLLAAGIDPNISNLFVQSHVII